VKGFFFVFYPLFLNIRDLPCLVVGGGRVGLRKVSGLLEAEARVTVVDPTPLEALQELGRGKKLTLVERTFRMEDLEGMRLVFAATHRKAVNGQVAEGARTRNIFCNVADDPQGSDFFLPALIRRGDLQLAISTGGRSPAFARKLRMDLEASLDRAYLPFLDLMGRLRAMLLERSHDPEGHKRIFRALVEGPLLEQIGKGDSEAVIQTLIPWVGTCGVRDLVLSVMQAGAVRSTPEEPGFSREKEDA
jgi:precorrin-2 dehydrogenase/sirohydrochlorin ferrochelatase